jgi:signal transduction histidine kinase
LYDPNDDSKRIELSAILIKVRGELRAVTGELQLPRFRHGFAPDLTDFLENFVEQNPSITITHDIRAELVPLGLPVYENLFRIFRTAVANVRKHAGTSALNVTFEQVGRATKLVIGDTGPGFTSEVTETLGSVNRYGLVLMRAYAREIGAKLEISSTLGEGTTITVIYVTPGWLRRKYLSRS